MGILLGFAPWIVYWVLVGNVPFLSAVLVALAVAVISFVIRRANKAPGVTLEIGAVGTFLILTALTLTVSQDFMERWIQPLSNAGIFVVALGGVLIGKPFIREFAAAGQPKNVVEGEIFIAFTTKLTWIWVAAFGGMTLSSVIPPIIQGDATILDTRTPLSFICYWVVPFSLLGLATLATRVLADRMIAEANSPNVVRKTNFLAFKELGIDELYYLAQQKAEREAGAGMEAFDVRVGGKGIPLTNDEDRESWPATYKVRERK